MITVQEIQRETKKMPPLDLPPPEIDELDELVEQVELLELDAFIEDGPLMLNETNLLSVPPRDIHCPIKRFS